MYYVLESKPFSFMASILKPKVLREKGSNPEAITMRANQVPLLINNVTTVHKLQWSAVDALFVHGCHYATNWVYVILSRVKTMKVCTWGWNVVGTSKNIECQVLSLVCYNIFGTRLQLTGATMIMTVCLIQFELSIARESMNDRQHWHGVVDC